MNRKPIYCALSLFLSALLLGACHVLVGPTPMEVYALLPRSNCRACGQGTCFVFAAKLVAGQVRLEECPPLQEPQFAEQRAKLEAQFGSDMPTIG